MHPASAASNNTMSNEGNRVAMFEAYWAIFRANTTECLEQGRELATPSPTAGSESVDMEDSHSDNPIGPVDDVRTHTASAARATTQAAEENVAANDLHFDPLRALDDPRVLKEYVQYVLDTATETPASSKWKKRWATRTILGTFGRVCYHCNKLIVVQYKCPSPCDPHFRNGRSWHRTCYMDYRSTLTRNRTRTKKANPKVPP